MFISMNRVRVKPGTGARFEERLAHPRGVEQAPGFVSLELLRLTEPEQPQDHEDYIILTRWNSREDFVAWTQSEAFRRVHAGPPADFLLSNEVGEYDVRIARGTPAPKP